VRLLVNVRELGIDIALERVVAILGHHHFMPSCLVRVKGSPY
jgi:hypothetical protein